MVQKGNIDSIKHMCHTMQCEEEGGLKRSGGIGHVLAGTMSAFMAWHVIVEQETPGGSSESSVGERRQRQRVYAAWAACCAVRKGTKRAFRNKRRAMSAMDVMGELGEAVDSMEGGLSVTLEDPIQHPNSSQDEAT